jgi:hypothetical protein
MSQKNNDMSQTDKHDMQICRHVLFIHDAKQELQKCHS